MRESKHEAYPVEIKGLPRGITLNLKNCFHLKKVIEKIIKLISN